MTSLGLSSLFETTTMASNTSTHRRPTSDTGPNAHTKRSHNQSLTHDISPPLANTRLSTLIYILVALTALLTAYFSYRTVQYKAQDQGWLSILIHGRTSPETHTQSASTQAVDDHADTIQSHVVALAAALGISTHELASAIAGAVSSYVPPASLSSIKARETGDVVSVLLQGPVPTPSDKGGGTWDAASTAAEVVVEEFVEGVESFVGMDEP